MQSLPLYVVLPYEGSIGIVPAWAWRQFLSLSGVYCASPQQRESLGRGPQVAFPRRCQRLVLVRGRVQARHHRRPILDVSICKQTRSNGSEGVRTVSVHLRMLPEAVLHFLECTNAVDSLGLVFGVDET